MCSIKTMSGVLQDLVLDNRLRFIVEALTLDIYNYTCLGLFERHKLMFSFQASPHQGTWPQLIPWYASPSMCLPTLSCARMQMAIKILQAEGAVDNTQLDFFLKGNLSLEKSQHRKPFAWIPDQVMQRSDQSAAFFVALCFSHCTLRPAETESVVGDRGGKIFYVCKRLLEAQSRRPWLRCLLR